MEIEYSQKHLVLLKWAFGAILVMAIVVTPIVTMEVVTGESAIWELAVGPLNFLVGVYFYRRCRKLSKHTGTVLSVTAEGLTIKDLAKKPIPWNAIASISAFGPWIVLSLKKGEIENLGLGKLNLRIRRMGPLSDKTITLSPALYNASKTVLQEEIGKQARAACGEAIRLNL
ncbi:hypothetical protein [Roseibium album]|uniref:hypothetical protein n=1 Tax=Roseibium album TaxID=311410 RepID=UPI002492250D|nr:hypothetical protein [Roseibium album]